MPATGLFLTVGGDILELDIPDSGFAAERFQEQLSKGDIQPIDPDSCEQVVTATDRVAVPGGGFETVETTRWVRKAVESEPEGGDPFAGLNVKALRALAEERGIDLDTAKSRAAIVERLTPLTATGDDPDPDEDPDVEG